MLSLFCFAAPGKHRSLEVCHCPARAIEVDVWRGRGDSDAYGGNIRSEASAMSAGAVRDGRVLAAPSQTLPRVSREVHRLLKAGVAGRVFPGATACVAYADASGRPVFVEGAAGSLGQGLGPVTSETIYDLASLTKSFVATTALRLAGSERLALDAKLSEVLTECRGAAQPEATLAALLSHRGGLEAWGGLYLDVPHEAGTAAARRWILCEAARRGSGAPGSCSYSDLGYMLAGEMVARLARKPLDQAVRDEVLVPLGIQREVEFAGGWLSGGDREGFRQRVAPTERCEWRGRMVTGEVHDENCAALGGVSGHAGLFGTALGVARFAWALLEAHSGAHELLVQETLHDALADKDGGRYRLGFDSKSPEGSSAGRHMSDATFGHLGFTGTSFWVDPTQRIVVVLLSNRVHPSRANEKIRAFRPAFHDGVMAAIKR